MIDNVSFHAAAEAEFHEAADYYELRVQGLGVAFLAEVERSTTFIQQNPETFPRILKVVRRKTLRRFPYSILYTFVDNTIRILAIANHKRRPFYWRSRK
ncbi:MAG: type II toxin-antitoxin system RelE/ParE family toxin [Ignavibacteriales bacterium]|nr:type II toxin-antitoxin system RelE/ParE family toxin [Ignavibacteriales bacterium]